MCFRLFGQLPFDMSIDVTSFDSCDFCSMVSNEAKDFLSNVLQKDPKLALLLESSYLVMFVCYV